jgi:hypothetical protein
MFFLINYYLLNQDKQSNVSKHFNIESKSKSLLLDTLYFTMTTYSSVGYGDIYPISDIAKFAILIHQFIIVLFQFELILEINK